MMPASQLVILCALAKGPATGYVIKKRIHEQAKDTPAVIPKNIYSKGGGVDILLQKGLIEVRTYVEDHREFSITRLGMETLQAQVVNLNTLRRMCVDAFWNYERTNARTEQPVAQG